MSKIPLQQSPHGKWKLPIKHLKNFDKKILGIYTTSTSRGFGKALSPNSPIRNRLKKNPSSECVHEKLVKLTPNSDMFIANNLVMSRPQSLTSLSPDKTKQAFKSTSHFTTKPTVMSSTASGPTSSYQLLLKNQSASKLKIPPLGIIPRARVVSPQPNQEDFNISSARSSSQFSVQYEDEKISLPGKENDLKSMQKMLQCMIRDQFPDLISKRDQIAQKLDYFQKTVLPLINDGLTVCYPESLAGQLGSLEEAKHVQDTFRRTLSLILANYQRMTLTDIELAKLVDLGHINRQFRLIHSNCYVLRAYSAVGLANILEARLQKDFSRKISVAII